MVLPPRPLDTVVRLAATACFVAIFLEVHSLVDVDLHAGSQEGEARETPLVVKF